MASIVPKLTEDILELYADRVISTNGIERLQYYQEFETWYVRSGYSDITRGRIFNYSEITEFLAILTVAHYQPDGLTDDGGLDKVPRSNPFRSWSSDDWSGMRDTLVAIHSSMLRVDANATLDETIENADTSGDKVDKERQVNKYFAEKFFEVLKRFTLHERLAPFRQHMDSGVAVTSHSKRSIGKGKLHSKARNDGALEMTDEFLEDFLDVMESEEDESIKTALLFLLEKDRKSFKSVKELQAILNDRGGPYSYDRLVERTDRLIRFWAEVVFDVPTLAGLYVHTEDKRKESRAMARLHRSRARLDEGVKDPLPKAVAAAARAQRLSHPSSNHDDDNNDEVEDRNTPLQRKKKRSRSRLRGGIIEPKQSAVQLAFTTEEESYDKEIEEINDEEEILPSIDRRPLKSMANKPSPSPWKRKRSQQKAYEGKRSWTVDEKNAIKEGILTCGNGKWALIKERFSNILDSRTSGQIKDCVRTMKSKGELQDILGEDEKDESEGVEGPTD